MGLYQRWQLVTQCDLYEKKKKKEKKTSWVPVSICLLERHLHLWEITCQRGVARNVYVELIKRHPMTDSSLLIAGDQLLR